jgi:ribosomal protein S3AE
MAIAKRKKKFYDIEIPLVNKETVARCFEIEELNNKYINYDLTRILRGKGTLLTLKIKVQDKKAVAEPLALQVLPFYIKRAIRKGTNYVEDSFFSNTKENKVRIKPILVTRKKVSRAVRKALRDLCKKELINYLNKTDTNGVFKDILENSIQKELSVKLKKVYPLAYVDIRVFKVYGERSLEIEELNKKELDLLKQKEEKRKIVVDKKKLELKKENKVEEVKTEVKVSKIEGKSQIEEIEEEKEVKKVKKEKVSKE